MNEQLKIGKKGLHMFFCVCLMAVLTVTDFSVPEKEQGFPGPWLICGELQHARPTVLAEDCTRIDTNGIESTVE
jgi:hypothetical protein